MPESWVLVIAARIITAEVVVLVQSVNSGDGANCLLFGHLAMFVDVTGLERFLDKPE